MKFDLELAKKGHPVQTVDGKKARIICFNTAGGYPLTVLIKYEANNLEEPHLHKENGKYLGDYPHGYDPEMVDNEKEYFVNVYKDRNGKIFLGDII